MLRDSVWDLIGRSLALSVFLDSKPPRPRRDDREPQRRERQTDLPERRREHRGAERR